MMKTEQGLEVYDNQIEFLFKQYFIDRGIDIEKDDIKQTKFNSAWKYVYKNLFMPDENTIRYNNKTSKINYDDVWEINRICNIYIDLCFEYNIRPCQYGFYRLTGITRETMRTWKNGEYRLGDDNATITHSGIIKKIDDAYKEYYQDNMTDTPIGQITMANNDDELGLLYAEKAAKAQAEANMMAAGLSREEIAARYAAFKEVPETLKLE